MGKSSSQTIGYRHRLGVQAVVCYGQIDGIFEFRYSDRQAWVGNGTGTITVSAPNLLGGDEREGGVSGYIDVEDGDAAQVINAYVDDIISTPYPAARGVSTVVFRGDYPTEREGFYWGNNPYLKDWSVLAQRIEKTTGGADQWYAAKDKIVSDNFEGSTADFENEITYAEPDVGIGTVYTAADTGYNWRNRTIGLTTAQHLWRTTDRTVGAFTFSKGAYDYWIDCPGGASTGRFSFYRQKWNTILPAGVTSDQVEVRITAEMARDTSSVSGSIGIRTSDNGTAAFSGTYGTVGFSGSETDWSEKDSGWVQITDNATDLYLSLSAQFGTIGIRNMQVFVRGDFGIIVYDMNPAHIIREALTDTDWGVGVPVADIDDTAFTAAADTLFDEGFGLSMWHEPDSQSPWDLIQTVLTHIDASFYVHRATGKYTLKLTRDDYSTSSPSDVLAFSQADILSMDVTQEQPHELANRVQLTYYDRKRRDLASLTVNNLARIQQTGRAQSAAIDMSGICKASLAARVAEREVRTLSTPKKKGTAELTRKASGLHPGDVISFTDDRYDLTGEVMRVLTVDEGDGRNNAVRVNFVQDVFSIYDDVFVEADEQEPDPTAVAAANAVGQLVQEAPYYEIVREVGDTTANSELTADPDQGYIHAAAGNPDGRHLFANLWVNDGGGYQDEGAFDFAPFGTITTALTADPTDTSIVLASRRATGSVVVGDLCQIGSEIMVVDAISGSSVTVGRGCLDTVPQAHTAGSYIVFWDRYAKKVETQYDNGESVTVDILTRTGTDVLTTAEATNNALTFARRAIRPYSAAKVQIGGAYLPTELTDGVSMTWVHRDRLTQTTASILDWTDASVGPESNTTYRIDFYAIDKDGIETTSPAYFSAGDSPTITGTSYTLNASDYRDAAPQSAREARIKITTQRDGYDSWQSWSVIVPIFQPLATEASEILTTEDGDTLLED